MPPAKPPANLPVVIHACLKPRWSWQPKAGQFATASREVAPEKLPSGTEISYLVDRLSKQATASLSTSEKKLARWVQIKLPPSANADAALQEILGWTCTAEAHIVPAPTPPRSMGMAPP